MVRRALHLLLVATVLLAGCSGLGGSDATESVTGTTTAPTANPTTTQGPDATPTPTRSPDPTDTPTTTPTQTADPVPASAVPPGANASHITNGRDLLVAHMTALRGNDYDATVTITARREDRIVADSRSRYANDPDRRRHVWVMATDDSTRIQYYNETSIYVRLTENGSTRTYRAAGGAYDSVPTLSIHRRHVSRFVRAGTYTANGTVTVGGRTLARNDLTAPADRFDANTTGYLLVRSNGAIHEAVLNATFSGEKYVRGRFRYVYRLDALGDVALSEPAWVANASD